MYYFEQIRIMNIAWSITNWTEKFNTLVLDRPRPKNENSVIILLTVPNFFALINQRKILGRL